LATGVNVTNILEFIIYKSSYKSTVLVPGQPCQPSLMFMSKAGAYPSEAYTLLYGRLLTLTTNIELCWKSLPGTSTLAYYEHLLITVVKSFISLGPGGAKLFIASALLI